ncbi:MAG: hypothetical protein MI802_23590 [Desulfobacterales bacterium]|nr:hypothetical protein [Desulfobacterales bacterium]
MIGKWKWALPAVLCVVSSAVAAPQDLGVFENFEGISPNTAVGAPINLGSSPNTATLGGDAFAGVIGVGPLYHSGIRSWMVLQESTGIIDFAENNASAVEFFVRTHPSADGDTVITAFDDLNQAIGSPITIAAGFADPSDPLGKGFTLVSFSGDIDHIIIDNNASNQINGIDDLGFTNIPEPASLAVLGLALPLCARRRKR